MVGEAAPTSLTIWSWIVRCLAYFVPKEFVWVRLDFHPSFCKPSLHLLRRNSKPGAETNKLWKVSLSRNSSSPPHLSLKKVSLKSRNSGPTNSTPWMNNHIHSSPTWWSVDLLGAMQDQHATLRAIPSGNTICSIRQIHFTPSDKYNLHGHMNQLHSSDIDSSPTHCVPPSINWIESAEGKCMEIGGTMKAHDDRNGRWTSDCDCWLPWASLKPPPTTIVLNVQQCSKCLMFNIPCFQRYLPPLMCQQCSNISLHFNCFLALC